MTKEAELLHFIDNIDSRMNAIDKALSGIEEGEFTARQFALEDRNFYKPLSKKCVYIHGGTLSAAVFL